ncbi:hypothetical protein V3851_24240 [Paenibacillus sp. M1]|uniref:Heat induced stress protein YflT n=1 Tax=Paenibacillus haidiansis TaxID=1574488 RepID=A0ABU7VYQ6_9BACL
MTKHIQAYFQNEDQAESARTSLLPFEMDLVEVSSLDHSIGRNHNLLVPLLPLNNGYSTANGVGVVGMPNTISAQGVIPVAALGDSDDEERMINGERADTEKDRPDFDSELSPVVDVTAADDDYENLKYVLTAKVKDAEYDDIVHKLRTHGAYVEHLD